MSTKTDKLAEELSQLTVLELSELKDILKDKWGVEAMAAPVAVAAPAGEAAAAVEESANFQVTLSAAPADKKIGIIKVVREVTGLGLKEAKDLVEAAPAEVKATSPKAEANEIKKKIEEAGGKVTLKGL